MINFKMFRIRFLKKQISAHYGAKQCEISHNHGDQEGDTSVQVPASYNIVSRMAGVGLVHAWVQLGHDGLPQEAGCPLQVREIYDSWRTQEHGCYKEELELVDTEIKTSDMILVFGYNPSLTGETAAQLSEVSQREFGNLGQSLGLIIVSEHPTHMDKFATIRINGNPDEALEKLKEALDLDSFSPIVVTETQMDANIEGNTNVTEETKQESGCKDEANDPACHDSSHRAFVADALTHFKQIEEDDPRIHHGRMLSETCLEAPDNNENKFEDKEHTLDYKIEKMINLVKLSRKTVFVMEALEADPVSCTLGNIMGKVI